VAGEARPDRRRLVILERAEQFAETAEQSSLDLGRLEALIDGRVGWDGAAQSFDDLARGRSTASKILVFPKGPPQT